MREKELARTLLRAALFILKKSNATEWFALPESYLRKTVTVLLLVFKVRETRSGVVKLV